MKRKLFALLMSGFAITLLMGAGVDDTAVVTQLTGTQTVEQLAPAEEPVDPIQTEYGIVEAQSEEVSPSAQEPETDTGLYVDAVPVSMSVSRSVVNGVTYVSLKAMAQVLDPESQVMWDEDTGTVTVTTASLLLEAKIGQRYLTANGRYLYVPDGIQVIDGQTIIPLKVLAKAFGAAVDWDESTQTVYVSTGAEPLVHGDEFYNSTDLFWLSRVIFAESGNQSLEGKLAVGNVVMNRVGHEVWPDTIYEVISQRNQFSTYKNGELGKRNPTEACIIAAKLVLDGAVVEEVENAYFFDSCRSSWASRNKNCVAVIGGHRFFDY